MAVRRPLYADADDIKTMTAEHLSRIRDRAVMMNGINPNPTVDIVVGNSGNLTAMSDTRTQAGTFQQSVSSFHPESTTSEPQTVTVSFDKLSNNPGSYSSSSGGGRTYPVYYVNGQIKVMSFTDFYDTFISPAIDILTDGNNRPGIYSITNTLTPLANHKLIEGTFGNVVFSDTRANTSLYSAGGIPEALDQPQTLVQYYLHRGESSLQSTETHPMPYKLNADGDLIPFTPTEFVALLQNELNFWMGIKVSYNINGAGQSRGTMTDTKLNGAGNYQQRYVNTNDYRSQEFPNGSAVTISTYNFNINRIV